MTVNSTLDFYQTAGAKELYRIRPHNVRPAALVRTFRHETFIYSLFPMHVGMRQYWRDPESLLVWTRSDHPHRQWWQGFFNRARGLDVIDLKAQAAAACPLRGTTR